MKLLAQYRDMRFDRTEDKLAVKESRAPTGQHRRLRRNVACRWDLGDGGFGYGGGEERSVQPKSTAEWREEVQMEKVL